MLFGLSKKIKASISLRLAFLFCLTFSVGITSAFLITYFEVRYSLEKSNQEILTAKNREFSALLSAKGILGVNEFLSLEKNRIINAPYFLRVLASNGETLFLKRSVQEENFDLDSILQKKIIPAEHVGWQVIGAVDDEDVFNILTEKVNNEFYLQVGQSSEDREAVLGKILEIFAIIGAFFILLSACLGFWYSKKALAPLRNLVSAIDRIEKGDFTQRADLGEAPFELLHLAETFNRMVVRIEKLIQVMKDSLDHLAHDIRTPLTRIRIVAEDALVSQKQSSLMEALEDCAEAATGLSEWVDQLMNLSEAESGTLSLSREESKISELLEDVVEVYEFVALEKDIRLQISTDSDLVWNLDRKRIKQAVANLLDNGIKFSKEGSLILISAWRDQNKLVIQVQDQGAGIPEADIERVWERLFRGDKSRTTQGSGLGLAIVQSIVLAHGGTVEVNSKPGVGSTFSMQLPS